MPKKVSWLSFVTFFRKIHQQETKVMEELKDKINLMQEETKSFI